MSVDSRKRIEGNIAMLDFDLSADSAFARLSGVCTNYPSKG